ncbi:MAG: hypothetical protein HQK91_05800 [Nitrospirae bacterium]|nr:hypothetical protein [Nitrospirota bacterium]
MNEVIFLYQDHLLVCSWQGGQYIKDRVELNAPIKTLASKRGYVLVIPDNLIHLVSTNITKTKSHKVKDTVKYHLAYLFPEEEIQGRFGYILSSCAYPIIACMYNEKLKSIYLKNKKLFDSASIITTPSIIILLSKQEASTPFSIRTESKMLLKHDNKFLHIVGNLTDYSFPMGIENIDINTTNSDVLLEFLTNIIKGQKDLTQLTLRLFIDDNKKNSFTLNKKDFFLIAIVYILFIAAMFLKTIPIEKNINNYKFALNEQYKKAGVLGEADPYGHLLFKVNQLTKQDSQGLNILQALSAIGNAFNDELSVENILITPSSIKMKGKISNYQSLEKGLIKLSKLIKIQLAIDNTDIQDNIVSFTVTGMMDK